MKKEINEEFDIDGPKTDDKENANYFEEFRYEDDTQNSFEGVCLQKQEGKVMARVKKKHKRKDKDKTKKVKKNKKLKAKKIKLLKIKSKSTINMLNSIIVKNEEAEIKSENNVLIPKSLVYNAPKKRKKKDGLTKTARAKLETIGKRQEREEHYQLFGKKYVCALCNKNFAIKVFLEKHMSKEHGAQKKEARWECDECGRFYASKRQLERHKMIHRGE